MGVVLANRVLSIGQTIRTERPTERAAETGTEVSPGFEPRILPRFRTVPRPRRARNAHAREQSLLRARPTPMASRVTTDTAGKYYERRHQRSWRLDAFMGVFIATTVLVRESIIRGAVHHGRKLEGRRKVDPAPPLPEWCRDACVGYQEKFGPCVNEDTPFLFRSIASPIFVQLADKLTQDVGDIDLNPLEELVLRTFLPQAEKILARFNEKRQRDPTLFGFYAGVRVMLRWTRSEEPKASDVALLAAASGVEPFTGRSPTLDSNRKRWEKRIKRWKEEMDEETWRAALETAAWAPELAQVLV